MSFAGAYTNGVGDSALQIFTYGNEEDAVSHISAQCVYAKSVLPPGDLYVRPSVQNQCDVQKIVQFMNSTNFNYIGDIPAIDAMMWQEPFSGVFVN